ncbi:MAG TPA: hypothetical protein VKS99_18610 [Blastocatellia bacterium]|nr:hypothetical protein [Blastocatellia bacterium]
MGKRLPDHLLSQFGMTNARLSSDFFVSGLNHQKGRGCGHGRHPHNKDGSG